MRTVLVGQTVQVEDGADYGPVTVALLDARRLAIRSVTRTDQTGAFHFTGMPPGRYVPVVYDTTRLLYHNSTASITLRAGRGARIVLPMIPYRGHAGLELHGRVVDATTGRPIVGAMVDLGSNGPGTLSNRPQPFSELDGQTGTLNQVTDEDGRFRLAPVYFFVLPPDGVPHTPELLVTAPGYRAYRRPGFTSEAELAPPLQVELVRGSDDGVVTGRLVGLDGLPVAGLRVGLEWTRVELPFKGAAQEPEWAPDVVVQDCVGVSGHDGRFCIDGAPSGYSLVMAAYPRDDGWVGQFGPGADLTTADSTDAGDIIVVPALLTTFPADRDTVVPPDVQFRWIPVSGARDYRVTLRAPSGAVSASLPLTEPTADPPDSLFAQPGPYLWIVQAFAPIGELSRTDRPRSFVIPPAAAATSPTPSGASR